MAVVIIIVSTNNLECGRFLWLPVDARTELFGTTRDTNLFHGNLRSRIEQLAEFLGAQTTKTMDADKRYDRIKAGDAGLDIVSFLKLDEASHIPVALAQCTCSYDEWINKQESINSDTWRTRIDPIAPFWRYMYVPFYCHNASGKFEQLTDIHTCLIDRQSAMNRWHDNWDAISPIFKFSKDVRTAFYTANAIESLNE